MPEIRESGAIEDKDRSEESFVSDAAASTETSSVVPSPPASCGQECPAGLATASFAPGSPQSPPTNATPDGESFVSDVAASSAPSSAATSPASSHASSSGLSDLPRSSASESSSAGVSPQGVPSMRAHIPPCSRGSSRSPEKAAPLARGLGPRSPEHGSPCTRPPPSLDHVAYGSNVSEVSEDLSVWGNLSPANSVGQSLEVSASVEGTAACALAAMESSKLGTPKPWATLQSELKLLTEALQGMKSVRAKQQEFLEHLRSMQC